MKSPHIKRALFASAALMTLEATCHTALAATGTQAPDIDGSPLTLTLQTPSGGTSRLTYVHEDGWRLEDYAAPSKQDEARITPTSAERQQEASSSEQPMSVFIDGPTGFTYVWVADQGWKFVGRLSDRNR
jgi:hypothetical protein